MEQEIIATCVEIENVLLRKNQDYGNSFGKTLEKYGDVALVLRLEDKFSRLESLLKNKANVDESFDDTVMDIAGYCLLYLASKK